MKKIFLILILFLLSSQAVIADHIFLNDGAVVHGLIEKSDESFITVKSEFGILTIPKNRVINIIMSAPQDNTNKQIIQKSNTNTYKNTELNSPENWYMLASFGGGNLMLKDDIKSSINQKSNNSLDEKSQIPFGYFNYSIFSSLGNNVLFGGGFSILASSWEKNIYESGQWIKKEYSLTHFLFHLDIKLFFKEITSGFYMTLSPGIGFIQFNDKTDQKNMVHYRSKLAHGGKAGFGYAFNLSRFNSAILLGIEGFYITAKYFESGTFNKWTSCGSFLNLGILW